jgi:hypothetical protein
MGRLVTERGTIGIGSGKGTESSIESCATETEIVLEIPQLLSWAISAGALRFSLFLSLISQTPFLFSLCRQPDDLFILFGVYGDVIRVKILYNRKDTALVQYQTAEQAYPSHYIPEAIATLAFSVPVPAPSCALSVADCVGTATWKFTAEIVTL